jgi:hypothetical protein
MTKEQFEKAANIEDQIASIDTILAELSKYTYSLQPPTRQTSWCLGLNIRSNALSLDLNEGEVVAIRDALESRKNVLEQEFERL